MCVKDVGKYYGLSYERNNYVSFQSTGLCMYIKSVTATALSK